MDWLFNPLIAANAAWIMALIGAATGSFLSLVTYRFIHEQPILGARSRCAACGTTLGVRDLIPIVSWATLRGKARCCGARISARYPLMELACSLSAAVLVQAYGWQPMTLTYIGMAWCIIGLLTADIEAYFLPDILMLPLGLLGVLHAYQLQLDAQTIAIAAGTGWGIGLLLHYGGAWVMKRPALGLGDVKLFGVAAIWLGSAIMLVPYLFLSGLLGIGLALMWRLIGRGEMFPFGPALLMALLVCVWWPEAVTFFWQLYH